MSGPRAGKNGKVNRMEQTNMHDLALTAARSRLLAMEMVHRAASGHIGGSLSAMDILTELYFRVMRVNPEQPRDPARDRFVLSKGHCTPALYPTLAQRGFFPVERLKEFRRIDGQMSGHAEMHHVPGVDMSTGSLGQGVSAAAGMALAAKYQGKDCRIYTLLGDGEIEEGQPWEAFMFAHQYKLDNLCVIIDNNNLQIDGKITDVMSPYPIPEKLRAFGFQVREIDGHDFEQMESAFDEARATKGVPFAIIMTTIKGKGVSFMEDVAGWHGKAPNDEEYKTAMDELKARLAEVEGM